MLELEIRQARRAELELSLETRNPMRLHVIATLALVVGSPFSFGAQDYLFGINPESSWATLSGTSSIGPIVGTNSPIALSGLTEMSLEEGGAAIAAAGFPGYSSFGAAHLTVTGEIPSPIPNDPSLATLSFDMRLKINSASFPVDAGLNFDAPATVTYSGGMLTVTTNSGTVGVVPLWGTKSNPMPLSGSFTWTGSTIRLECELACSFPFTDPVTGISGQLDLPLSISAFIPGTSPSYYCYSTANSTGLPSLLVLTGGTSLGLSLPTLVVERAPSNTFGVIFYGPNQTILPFGNGIRCVAGPIQRLAPVITGPDGTLTQLINNSVLPASMPAVPAEWLNFQFWHRDVAAGGAMFNTSNGVNIGFLP
ncbi:MAG: hypothetical protein ACI8X5_002426 [Planctomycetota bacterium]|jgi:hypothetical protein